MEKLQIESLKSDFSARFEKIFESYITKLSEEERTEDSIQRIRSIIFIKCLSILIEEAEKYGINSSEVLKSGIMASTKAEFRRRMSNKERGAKEDWKETASIFEEVIVIGSESKREFHLSFLQDCIERVKT